jgi:hypothetical protein
MAARVKFFQEPAPDLFGPAFVPTVYHCDHPGCGAFACHGYGVSLRAGIRGRWLCASHNQEENHGFRRTTKSDITGGKREDVPLGLDAAGPEEEFNPTAPPPASYDGPVG